MTTITTTIKSEDIDTFIGDMDNNLVDDDFTIIDTAELVYIDDSLYVGLDFPTNNEHFCNI